MPTITSNLRELQALAGQRFSVAELDLLLELVKGELKSHDDATGELRIELNDTNRPDLWCTEGIARQLRARQSGVQPSILGTPGQKELKVEWIDYRPYAACFLARGLKVDATVLAGIIETQEKLTDNFGHKRKSVSIGVYDARDIKFPVAYRGVAPHARSFVPLGEERAMTLAEILDQHPKGREYAHILRGHEIVPILEDASGKILSFPPIINSRELGEVEPGDDFLMIEVTGTDLARCLLVLNVFAANLADRGATIEAVTAVLPAKAVTGNAAAFGARVVAPQMLGRELEVPVAEFRRLLGDDTLDAASIVDLLQRYGVTASATGATNAKAAAIRARTPAYRNDYLHAVDVIEDLAISRGYSSFAPVMPREFTVGNLSRETLLADRVRDILLSFGFEELVSNVLTNRIEMRERMQLGDEPLVTIANVMSETYSVVRDAILPLLLRAEAASGMALYPHRMFEVGEVAVFDTSAIQGSRTIDRAAVAIAHGEANFSEAHGYLERLAYELALEITLEPIDHQSYIPGRAGAIHSQGRAIGIIGELHPAVLEAWGIKVPVAAFELSL